MVAPLANANSQGELETLITLLMICTAITGFAYTLKALRRSPDRQVTNFARLRCGIFGGVLIIGTYMAEGVLWFCASNKYGALFWRGELGWKVFMTGLTIGTLGTLMGVIWRYHILVWPNKPN